MADDQAKLNIVITAEDDASGVISGLNTQIKTQQESFDELTASMNAMDVSAAKAKAGMAQMGAEAGEAGTEVQTLSAETEEAEVASDAFGESLNRQASRFVAHAIVIGSLFAAYNYLKDAVTDAEAANENFTEAMKKDDDASTAFKTSLGEALAPAIISVRDSLSGVNDKADDTANKFHDLGLAAYRVANFILAIGTGAQIGFTFLIGTIQESIDSIKNKMSGGTGISDAMKIDKAAMDTVITILRGDLSTEMDKAGGKGFDQLFNNFTNGAAAATKAGEQLSKAMQTMKDDADALDKKVTEDLQNLTTTHESNVDAIGKKLGQLSDQYQDTETQASDALKSLSEKNRSAMDSIESSIASAQTSIKNLNDAYAATQTGNTNTLVQAFAKAKEDLVSLQADISDPTVSFSTKTDDQAKIDQIKTSLAANADLVAQYQDQITAQQKFDAEGSLQQAIDTFNIKQKQDQIAYQTKLAQYQDELIKLQQKEQVEQQSYYNDVQRTALSYADKLKKLSDEIVAQQEAYVKEMTLFQDKETALKNIQAEAEKAMQEANTATKNLTIANINEEIAAIQRLSAAMSAVNSAKSGAAVGTAVANLPHLAEGGIVSSPTIALIGEAGPEMVVPLNRAGGLGGGGISIVINNPSVRNDGDISEIKRQLELVFRQVLRNAKIAYS